MSGEGLRILVVEDYPTNRIVMSRFLEPYGSVDLAENGIEAIDRFRTASDSGEPYDLICLDIMLPRMDGHEVLARIRDFERKNGVAAGERVRIIMTSALGDSRNIMAAFRGECESYLQKPIAKERLVEELRELGLLERGDS